MAIPQRRTTTRTAKVQSDDAIRLSSVNCWMAHLPLLTFCLFVVNCSAVLLRGQVRRRWLGARSTSESGLNLAPSNRQLDWHRLLWNPWLKHVGLDFQLAVSVADHVEPDAVLVCYWYVQLFLSMFICAFNVSFILIPNGCNRFR